MEISNEMLELLQNGYPNEGEKTTIKIMTFNLRNESLKDGINRFSLRTDRVIDAIQSELPDLIGFQEAPDVARDFLREALKDEYYVIGGGPKLHYRKSGNAIAFRRDAFELIGLETKWLSLTPDIPGSRYEDSDQSQCPRNYHIARLRLKATNTIICFVATHTDHQGKKVRVLEAHQLMDVVRQIGNQPMVLVGDFNAMPDEESIGVLTSDASLMVDVTQNLGGTYHAFGKVAPPLKIDYIFTNLPCVESYAVKNEPIDGVYISDHDPVVAVLKLQNGLK